MSDTSQPAKQSGRGVLIYVVTLAAVTAVTVAVTALLMNIFQRQQEGQQYYVQMVELTEDTTDPDEWGKNFPSQYDGYLRTVDTERTKHGGSDAFSKLEKDPFLVKFYKGYLFSVDFREERGHAYMLKDQDETLRVKQGKQPGACLHCHSSVIPAYRDAGKGDVMKGFEVVCAMDYPEARKLVKHPVACIDCHDPKTMHLRVTRPGFLNAIQVLAKSDYPLPQFQSIERWRKDKTKGRGDYDVNKMATRQELRSFVCGQCHVEYYFKGQGKLLTYPWHKGLRADQIEDYYDSVQFTDWTHEETGAPMLKAQHPEFELWNQGIHARSGVACADCHMPYKREGAVKISDHHIRSPLLNVDRACLTCHHSSSEEMKARAEAIQDKTEMMLGKAKSAVGLLIGELKAAKALEPAALEGAKKLHRKANWYLDFVLSENSYGFHAPQESARLLAEAIDAAHTGRISILEAKAKN